MALTTNSLVIPAADSGLIFTNMRKSSAFAAASNSIEIPGSGSVLYTLGDATAYVVGEGQVKPESTPAVASKLLKAHTFAVLVVISEQLAADKAALVNAVREQAPTAIAKKFDSLVRGLQVAAPADFDTLGDADVVAVTDYATWNSALAAVAASGQEATAVVLSSAMKYYLMSLTTAIGTPVFNIDATTINGLPYFTYLSAVREGFVGPFNRAVEGHVNGITVSASNSATVDGVSMFETNQIAVRVEARLGYLVADVAEFVKIVDAIPAQ